MNTTVLLALFWAGQVAAQVFFKYGSGDKSRWLPCFILGNVFGASSIWFLMKLYSRMNPNLAMALGGGGAFLGRVPKVGGNSVEKKTALPYLEAGWIGVVTAS